MAEVFMIPEKDADPLVEAAERALDEPRLRAGKEYLAALTRLGLEPDVLCWAYDEDHDEMQLAIVTTLAERVDGLSIYRLLFRAYEAAATPREIDPFIVSVYGPGSQFGVRLRRFLGGMAERGIFTTPEKAARFVLSSGEPSKKLVVLGRGVYVAKEGRRSASADLLRFQRFQKCVEALAA